jgi:tetratricopeptide (TPR) repeat protein
MSRLRRRWDRLALALLLVVAVAAGGLQLWAWYQFRAADRCLEKYQFAEAYEHYRKCLNVWRWSATTHFLAGQTARRAQMYDQADQHYNACVALEGPSHSRTLQIALERLLIQAQQGQFADIEEPLWDAIKKDRPETPLILEAMARGYMRMLRVGPAMECLRRILERDPNHVDALANRALAYERTGSVVEAEKDYRRALALDPERDDARFSLAQILLSANPEEAREQFEQLRARQPDNAEVLIGLAAAYRTLGEGDKARPLLDAILAKEPGNSKGLAELGLLIIASGQTAEGEALLRRAIAADPANQEAQYQLYLFLRQDPARQAEANAQREQYKKVDADRIRLAEIVGKEMSRKPYDPDLHSELGRIYIQYGKPDVGVRWLYSALRLDPNHQPSHQALYEYFKSIGDTTKAEQHRLQLRTPPTQAASSKS